MIRFVPLTITRWWLALVLIALVSGCRAPHPGSALQRYEFRQPHMGTLFTIKVYALDEATARVGTDAAFAKVAALDKMMTDYDPDSELMRLCRRPVGEPTRVSDELFEILQESQRIAKLTDGAFDVTIGPVVRLWRRARRAEAMPSPEQLARARESVGWQKLKLDSVTKTVTLTVPNMQLDLGGIAKGYAADKALGELKRHGFGHVLVAASGDIAVGSPPPNERGWQIGIGALDQTNGAATTILLKDAAISTSGDAEQFVDIGGKRYSHIVDPRTGIGLTERLQVSVIGKHATQTDALATAASVLGWQRGQAVINAQSDLRSVFVRFHDGKPEVRSTFVPELH